MKRIFSVSYSPELMDTWLLLLRIGVAALMLTHGLPKLQMLMDGRAGNFADPIGLGSTITLILTVFAEVVCSVLIFIGLATRLATIPLIFTMLIAVTVVHAEDPFARKEIGLLFLLIYITLLIVGSGKYSMDQMVSGKNKFR